MGIPFITVDTHSLVWYVDEASNRKLSAKALETIDQAELYGKIFVSVIYLVKTAIRASG